MIYNLAYHPDLTCPTNLVFTVDILCLSGIGLQLNYCLQGNLQHLRIPKTQPPAMTDGLWEHTCFEVFIATEGDSAYQEFNFSPSGQWAHYVFSDYRQRRAWHSDHVYALDVERSDTDLQMNVIIPLHELALIDNSKTVQIGITAVLEAADGELSYWALHHPAKTPDFHHRDGFIYSLAPHSL